MIFRETLQEWNNTEKLNYFLYNSIKIIFLMKIQKMMKLICLTLVAFVLGFGNIHAQKMHPNKVEKRENAPQVRTIESIEKVSDPVVVESEILESTFKVANKNANRTVQPDPSVVLAKKQAKIAKQKEKERLALRKPKPTLSAAEIKALTEMKINRSLQGLFGKPINNKKL